MTHDRDMGFVRERRRAGVAGIDLAAVGHVREVWATPQWGQEDHGVVWFDGGDVKWLA